MSLTIVMTPKNVFTEIMNKIFSYQFLSFEHMLSVLFSPTFILNVNHYLEVLNTRYQQYNNLQLSFKLLFSLSKIYLNSKRSSSAHVCLADLFRCAHKNIVFTESVTTEEM